MTHLRDRISIRATVPQTEDRLESYFASRRGLDGIARLRLHVPVNRTSQELFSNREVRIEAWHDRGDHKVKDLIRVTWTPEGSVIFPKFAGTLAVRGKGDREVTFIELDGHYQRPISAAGELFDEAIGHRIAQSTARELLKDLKSGIEAIHVLR